MKTKRKKVAPPPGLGWISRADAIAAVESSMTQYAFRNLQQVKAHIIARLQALEARP